MRLKYLTLLIYLLAALAACSSWLIGQEEGYRMASLKLTFLVPPLLFVFAYPRFLFASSTSQASRQQSALIFHGLAATVSTILFVIFGSAFWKNPLRDGESISKIFLGIPLIALPTFLIVARSLLLKNRTRFANFAAFLFWPYWLLAALIFLGRFFEATLFHSALCFLCFTTAVLFAFAAGAASHRPTAAHAIALAGLVGMPWVYWAILRDTPLGNVWTMFNVAERDLLAYNNLRDAKLTIFFVGLFVLAIATAALRLLPGRWRLRDVPICERTWPAFGASFVFLAVWFSQSVMPYRISGALDYSRWPVLEILHIEKRGLQFHETCVKVWGYRDDPESLSLSWNNRRLFQYRFLQKTASGELNGPLTQRIRAVIQSSKSVKADRQEVKPLRTWNVDGWYLSGTEIGLAAYASDKGNTPPQDVINLFNDLSQISHAEETQSEMADVCFGFCYDPLSGLGLLYANHRCRYDAIRKDYVCR